MATFSKRTVTTTRVEFVVPAEFPHGGACWIEVYEAVSVAQQELRRSDPKRYSDDRGVLPDDAIRIRPEENEIVVSYETTRRERE